MAILNNYPGTCETCGTRVPARAGQAYKKDSRWVVRCAACDTAAPARALLALVIRVWIAAGRVLCAPVSRLNGSFDKYLAATRSAGFYFSKADNCQVGTVAQATALVAALRDAGFTPDVSPDLVAALQARAATAKQEVVQADTRATAIDVELATRGLALFPFQRSGITWLASRRKALLADSPGLGKTCQALLAIPTNTPVVVVCPAVAKGVWVAEAKRFRPDLTPVVINGRDNFRWAQPGEMIICNFAILPGDKPVKKGYPATLPANLTTCSQNTVLIADEAQAFGSSSALRTAQFRALRDVALTANGRVWLLTGSPMGNRATELWAICQALGAGREVFGDYEAYQRMWNCTEGRYGVQWGSPTPEVASRLQKIMLRRLKSEVLTQLPAKTVRDLEVNGLSESVKALCDKTLAALEENGVSLEKALATATAANRSLAFTQLAKARAALATVKLGAAEELIESYEDANEPVVVFSAHRAPIDALGKREGWATITGDTSDANRSKIVEEFQAGNLRGIAATIKAAGVAITLTRAASAIFIDEEWNPEWNRQAQDRVYRIGQSRGVVITRLVAAHALDRHVANLLADKATMIAGAIDAAARGGNESVPVEFPAIDIDAIVRDNEKAIEAEVAVIEAEKAIEATISSDGDEVDIAVAVECPF